LRGENAFEVEPIFCIVGVVAVNAVTVDQVPGK